jgi:hypothetical protein
MNRETVQSVTEWADNTFGPATIFTQFERAKQEMGELEKHFSRTASLWGDEVAEEASDVVICLYRIIGTLDPQAIEKKMAINRRRTWNVAGDGTAQHIEGSDDAEKSH